MRERIERGERDPAAFRAALLDVGIALRDAWVDRVLGIGEMADDERLPAGCVPYLPSPVDALLRVVEEVREGDVIVDVGAGAGRAAIFLHLATGAPVIGLEIQPALVRAARELAARLGAHDVTFVE